MQTTNKWAHVSFFFGIFFISFILWNRLIRVRLPRELFITNEYDLIFFIVLLFATLFGLLFLYYFLNLIKYLPKEPGKIIKRVLIVEEKIKNYNFYKFIQQILEAFMDGPINVYIILSNQFAFVRRSLKKVSFHLFTIFTEHKKLPYLVYLFLIVFPRLIVSIVLIIEVIYLRELNNFYKVLPLLLIPLTVKAYFGILKFHTENVINYYERYLSFLDDEENKILHITIKDLTDPKEIKEQEEILKGEEETRAEGRSSYLVSQWDLYYNKFTGLYRIFIIDIYDKYKNMLYTIYYMLYFIGFLFYLLILIGVY